MNRTYAVIGAAGTATIALILVSGLLTGPPLRALAQPAATPTTSPVTREITLSEREKALVKEHVYGGLPSTANLYVRNGYVLCYAPERRVPKWVAYHVTPDCRNTPYRIDKYNDFNDDPDITREARDADYKGLHSGANPTYYDRGHLAPFAVMGGRPRR